MTNPDYLPPASNPEQLPAFDRALANIQEVLYSSPRTQVPEEDQPGDLKHSITFGTYTASEHVDDTGQSQYRAGTTGDLVWVFDPDTRKVHYGKQNPSLGLELRDMREVDEHSYLGFTDQLPGLLAAAQANKQVDYPQTRLQAFLGKIASGRKRKNS